MKQTGLLLCLVLASTYSEKCIDDDDRISKIETILHQQSILMQQQTTQIKTLQTMVETQNIEISQLKMMISDSRDNPMVVEEQSENIVDKFIEFNANLNSTHVREGDMEEYSSSSKTDQNIKKSMVPLSRDIRLLMGASTTLPPRTNAVAFYAYLSKNELAPSTHHTIIFDTVKTNIQNCYNAFSGVFTPPVDGVYGLAYTMRIACQNNYASFEIVQNGVVQGEIHVRAGNCGGQTSSGTIVVVANKGDTIYVRTHPTLKATGDIWSDSNGWSFFAGWFISP